MRLFEKYISMLLTAILCLTLIHGFPALSAPVEDDTIEKLQAFGILTQEETGLLKSKSPLSRGNFIRLMVRLSGIEPESIVGAQYTAPFGDVSQSDENYKFLCTAYEIGLAEGTTGAMFRPNDPVTRDMAAKLLVTVLGYKTLAEMQGGYPTGYQIVANQLKLFAGCGSSTEITGAVAATMIENALDAPVFQVKTIGGTSVTLDSDAHDTLLKERFHIYRTDGVLDGTEITTLLTGSSSIRQGYVTVDGKSYAAGKTQAADLLGYSVAAYYREEQGEDCTLVYVAPKRNKNETLTLDIEDISEVTAQKLTYADEGGKLRTAEISRLASVIYNGKQTPFSSSLFETECGRLTLIDNDKDGAYDVLLLDVYRTIVVSGVSVTTCMVTDYLGGEPVELDAASSEYHLHMTSNGQTISTEELAQWNVLSYAEAIGEGKPIKTVLVNKKSVNGTVNTINESDRKATIEGKEYDVSDSMMKILKVGDEGNFYIDAFGRVVASNSERDMVYGFVKAGKEGNLGGYMLKIFTENNRWVELPLRSKLRLNGETGRTAAEAYRLLTENGTVKPQLVTYRVSAEREISELNTAQEIGSGSAEEEAAIRDGIFRKSMTFTAVVYRNMSSSRSFEDYACVKDAKVFQIPPHPESAQDDEFSAGGVGLLVHDRSYTNVNLYDMDELCCAKACTVDKKTTNISNSSPYMLVTDINEAVNDDDEPVYALRGMYNGSMSMVYTIDKTIVDSKNLRKGDVIQFSTNDNGDVENIVQQFKAEEGFTQKGIKGSAYSETTMLRGQVVKANAAEKEMVIDYGTRRGVFPITSKAKIYLYDPIQNRSTVGTVNDIAQGDYIFYTARYFDINTIVIFKEY
ncbi:MAG: S-layer homology domain-containing protein [Clostridia bacterium]|nr:S-layer homology domain-containing protein [Clostridia bacterium]